MENRGLLFIPDISGFTQFVNQTDIEHSRLIIQELLELLINANQMGLEVSEVEGDAILFYKFGDAPGLEELYRQVERMFTEFHRSLLVYDLNRFCQCKACRSAINLTLKVITHYGEFAGYNVKTFNKLIGKDVIVAHQLLKNDIDQHEYWLVTKNVVPGNQPAGLKDWMKWDSSAKQTESGEIGFHYTQLGALKNEIPATPALNLELSDKVKMFSLTRDYDAEIIPLFHATGDFKYRSKWQQGVKDVEGLSHFLPRLGMRTRFVLDTGEAIVYASSYTFSHERIEFSETDEGKKTSVNFVLETVTETKTRLTINYYIRKNSFDEFMFKLTRRHKLQKAWLRSMEKLQDLVRGIKLPKNVE